MGAPRTLSLHKSFLILAVQAMFMFVTDSRRGNCDVIVPNVCLNVHSVFSMAKLDKYIGHKPKL